MITPRHMGRQSYARSDSTDSQTPLTDNLEFYYPPHKRAVQPLGREAPQQPERRTWRWLRFLRFGPREVQSQVPNHRFRVEGPDESSVGHGDASLHSPNVAVRSGWTSGLPSLPERDGGDPNRGYYDRVIQIGDPDTAQSTPMTPVNYEGVAEVIVTPPSAPPSVRTPAPDYSSAVEYHFMPVTSNPRTMGTAPTTVIPQNPHYTPVSPGQVGVYVLADFVATRNLSAQGYPRHQCIAQYHAAVIHLQRVSSILHILTQCRSIPGRCVL